MLALLLAACAGDTSDDKALDSADDADADTDTDTDTDTDADTDTDPGDGAISGTVQYYDGTIASGFPVQVCSLLCRYVDTDASGNFALTGLDAGDYRVDTVGAEEGRNLGNFVVNVPLLESEIRAITPALWVPHVEGPVVSNEVAGRDTYTVGDVTLTFAATDLELIFGTADPDTGDFDVYAGVANGADLPAFWSVTPTFAVTLLPWAAGVLAGFDMEVDGLTAPDGTYQVYALDDFGRLEQVPVGTASVSGGHATATGLTPEVWTWLLFVAE